MKGKMMTLKNQLSPEIEAILADAVHAELFASHLYKHVANQLQRLGYFGAQKFFLSESQDELGHYQRHVDYVNDRGGVAALPGLADVTDTVASLRDALELAYDTELTLQSNYADWYGQVDVITQQHLLQFIEIQRKSVGEYGDLIARLDRVEDDPCGVLMIDQELGKD
jgi:ferritin